MTVFSTILTKLTFSWIINEIYVNILIFVHGWTQNAPRIPKIYNINGIWSTDQKLLTVKPIATLRSTMKMKMKWKTADGKTKDIWRKSYINKKRWGAQDIWPPDWLTHWLNEWQATKDVVAFLNNEWRMCQYFNIFIQLNHKCIISFASKEYIPSY